MDEKRELDKSLQAANAEVESAQARLALLNQEKTAAVGARTEALQKADSESNACHQSEKQLSTHNTAQATTKAVKEREMSAIKVDIEQGHKKQSESEEALKKNRIEEQKTKV